MFKPTTSVQVKLFGIFLFLSFGCTFSYSAKAQPKDSASQTINYNYDVKFYNLRVWVDVDTKSIHGQNTIHLKTLQKTDSINIDLFAQYKVAGVLFHGQWMKMRRTANKIVVQFPSTLPKDTIVSVQVHYSGQPPVAVKPPWQGGFVWAKDSLGRPWAAVACEQLGASSWWPCKDSWADEPDSMRMTFFVPRGMFGISNGQLRSIYPPEDNKYTGFEWFVSYPINLYDVTLNVGYYDRIRDNFTSQRKHQNLINKHDYTSDNSVLNTDSMPYNYSVDYFFQDYNIAKAKAFFADSIYARTKTMLKCFEKYFGVYPFYRDGYALVETPYWGMEHQSAVAYGNNFKLNLYGFDFILVHESAHEWWGNAVTANDPGDMWIHESFTTYSEALYVEYLYGYQRSVEYLKMQKPNIKNKNPVQGPRNVNFHDRTDNDIYYKGSWMLHTLRSVIDNDSLFLAMLYGLQQEFHYKTIATEDMINYIEKYTKKDLKAFFQQYLYESALPVFQYSVSTKNGKTELRYRWQKTTKDFDMPIDVYIQGTKHRLQPKPTFQKLKLLDVKAADIKVDTDRFLVEVLNGI